MLLYRPNKFLDRHPTPRIWGLTDRPNIENYPDGRSRGGHLRWCISKVASREYILDRGTSILTPGTTVHNQLMLRWWADRLFGVSVCALWDKVINQGKHPYPWNFLFSYSYVINFYKASLQNIQKIRRIIFIHYIVHYQFYQNGNSWSLPSSIFIPVIFILLAISDSSFPVPL